MTTHQFLNVSDLTGPPSGSTRLYKTVVLMPLFYIIFLLYS